VVCLTKALRRIGWVERAFGDSREMDSKKKVKKGRRTACGVGLREGREERKGNEEKGILEQEEARSCRGEIRGETRRGRRLSCIRAVQSESGWGGGGGKVDCMGGGEG